MRSGSWRKPRMPSWEGGSGLSYGHPTTQKTTFLLHLINTAKLLGSEPTVHSQSELCHGLNHCSEHLCCCLHMQYLEAQSSHG